MQIWVKRAQNGPKIGFFKIFWKNSLLVYTGNNLKWKVILLMIFHQQIPYLAKFWFLSYGPKCCWPIKLQGSLKCNILSKKRVMFIFGIHIEVFYMLIQSFWVCVVRHAQSAKNKFVYVSNISRKILKMNMIFCLQKNTKVFYIW